MGPQPCPLPVLGTALALDWWLQEPPLSLHPVMAIGTLADRIETHIFHPDQPGQHPVLAGALGWVIGLGVASGVGVIVGTTPRLLQALALWSLFSHRMLTDEVEQVETALGVSVEDGRKQVARIVSRDTTLLSPAQVRMAAIESLAENCSDSVTAPLLFWAVAGMPGVWAYRWINTADARFGYRDSRWEYLGKVAAIADDIANLLPARLTGLLIASWPEGIRHLRREAKRTPSPNAGWPMGAMARALGVRLEKPGVYTLNGKGREPVSADIPRAVRRVNRVALCVGALAGLIACARWRR